MDKMDNENELFENFKAGKINLQNDELLEYLSNAFIGTEKHSENVRKLIAENGKKYIAKILISTKNETNKLIIDVVIKGLKQLFDENYNFLLRQTFFNHEALRKMEELVGYADLLSLVNVNYENIEFFEAQIAKYSFDFNTALEKVKILEKLKPIKVNVLSLINSINKEISDIENTHIELAKTEHDFLIEKAFDLFNQPLEVCKIMNYYKRNGFTDVYYVLLNNLLENALQEGIEHHQYSDMILDMNILIYLEPEQVLGFVTRAFAKWKNDDPVGAKRDMDKAFELEPNFDFDVIGKYKMLVRDIAENEINNFFKITRTIVR